jgi:hypothetical protein
VRRPTPLRTTDRFTLARVLTMLARAGVDKLNKLAKKNKKQKKKKTVRDSVGKAKFATAVQSSLRCAV